MYQAALNDVPEEITEAAMIDGAGGLKRLWYITLPMIRRSIATNLMLITLQTLSVFTLIYVMTAGGPAGASTTLPLMAYEEAFSYSDVGYGTAIAVVMLLIGAVFSVIYIRALRERKGWTDETVPVALSVGFRHGRSTVAVLANVLLAGRLRRASCCR